MYLVDTSVVIDFIKGKETKESNHFEEIIEHGIPFGISAFTYQEVLQGSRDKKEYESLQQYLSTQKIYYPTPETFEDASKLFFDCRKAGITIRSTIDTLIATTAMNNRLKLLCSDRDFTFMQKVIDLEIWNG